MSKLTAQLVILALALILPILSYAMTPFYIYDSHGHRHLVTAKMMLFERGRVVRDGYYHLENGKTIRVHDGYVVRQK